MAAEELFRPRSQPQSFSRGDDQRDLGSHDDYVSYLVDSNGNAYEPYSLAWRYLGMFLDCDVSSSTDSDNRRSLGSGDDGNDCTRKILWAAYHDPRYRGGTIGEYKFYDWEEDTWDESTCKTKRCARMDCHEPNTHFKLVGVFKETDGLEDWAEQLFKHEGICVWNDDDTYEFMQKERERWPTQCKKLSLPDSSGNTLYLHTMPLGEGNMTYGIYSDEKCVQASESVSFSDYVILYYSYYYYYYVDGESQAAQWELSFALWNDYMTAFKVCQPCRAYSLNKNDNDEKDDRDHRLLGGDENDGEGGDEQWGYNCYDDAGYTNCNQCYKFETHTDLEEASMTDLARASSQGTILSIKVNGKTFGQGGFQSAPETLSGDVVLLLIAGMSVLGGGLLFFVARRYFSSIRRLALPSSMQQTLRLQNESAEVT